MVPYTVARLLIGCNNKLILTSWQSVVDFLPSGSTARALPTGTLTNPGQSYQNVLAGQIAAATLNVKFDSASASFSPNSILLKDLIIASGHFSGWTISQLLAEANRAIGGCGSAYSFSGLNSALDMFNNNYNMSEFMNSPLNNRCFLSCSITVASSARPMASRENHTDVVMAQNALRVFPNPANEKINIRFAASSPMKVRMELLSTTGSKIIQLPATTLEKGGVAEKSIATAQLAPGMYYIKVIDEYGRQIDIQKVIVRK